MSFANSQPKNYIFISSENEDKLEEFVKIAATYIKDKKIVLLLTRKHVDFMSVLAGLNKQQLKNLIISFEFDVNGIISKLLEFHSWTILPDLVILNLNSYFDAACATPPFKKVCFCISALLSYMKSVEIQRSANQHDVTHRRAKSVCLLNAHQDVQMQLLIDFYFYKMAAFDGFDEIKNEILN